MNLQRPFLKNTQYIVTWRINLSTVKYALHHGLLTSEWWLIPAANSCPSSIRLIGFTCLTQTALCPVHGAKLGFKKKHYCFQQVSKVTWSLFGAVTGPKINNCLCEFRVWNSCVSATLVRAVKSVLHHELRAAAFRELNSYSRCGTLKLDWSLLLTCSHGPPHPHPRRDGTLSCFFSQQ